MKLRLSKTEIYIWAVIVSVFVALLLLYFATVKEGNFVQVSVEGKVIATYPLSENARYPIVGKGKNVLIIQDGQAYIEEADCPDKLCVKQGKIKNVGQSLICLPNKVVVEVISKDGDDQEIDAIVK